MLPEFKAVQSSLRIRCGIGNAATSVEDLCSYQRCFRVRQLRAPVEGILDSGISDLVGFDQPFAMQQRECRQIHAGSLGTLVGKQRSPAQCA